MTHAAILNQKMSSVEPKLGAELHNNGLICFSDGTLRYKIQSFLLGCGFKWICINEHQESYIELIAVCISPTL
jgi:hypothetical protein